MSNLTFTADELHKRLKSLSQRATALCGVTTDKSPLGAAVSQYLSAMADDSINVTPAFLKRRKEFLQRTEHDPVARGQLCALRIQQFNNYLMASQRFNGMFYEIVNLAEDDRPLAQNNTTQEMRVGYVGGDGSPQTRKILKDQVEELIPLHFLTTPEARYRKWDIYNGSIIDAALQTIRLADDMKNKMEQIGFNLLTAPLANGGVFGTFTLTGNKASRIYVPNSRINLANLPTTNDITLPDNSPTTKFRFAVLAAGANYGAQWGDDAFPEGPLVPTGRVLVPSSETTGLADEVKPTGNASTTVAEQILQQGWGRTDYLGRPWTLIGDNTLAPGAAYFEFNRKAGRIYLKPSMDMEKVSSGYTDDLQNEESRWVRKVFGAFAPAPWRMNILRVTYTTPT